MRRGTLQEVSSLLMVGPSALVAVSKADLRVVC
jgi:hypothetical protein